MTDDSLSGVLRDFTRRVAGSLGRALGNENPINYRDRREIAGRLPIQADGDYFRNALHNPIDAR